MVRYAALNGIDHPDGLRDFDLEDYQFVPAGSDETRCCSAATRRRVEYCAV